MVDWLKTGISGCQFARAFARDRGPAEIRISAVGALDEGPVADTLQALLTQAAAARTAVIFVFPRMRVDEEIADLLSTLALNPSFKLSEKVWPAGSTRQEILVKLYWHTPTGNWSKVMRLAPSGIMPVTRRAPFVGLMIWPGGHDNVYRPRNDSTVGVADMKFTMTKATYDTMWEQTTAAKAKRDALEPTTSASFRDVAFCLHQRVRDRLKLSA